MNGTPSTVNSGNPYRTGDHTEQQEKLPEITTSTAGQGSLAGAAQALPVNHKHLSEPALSPPPSKNIQFDRTARCLATTDSESISQCATAIKQAFPLPTTEQMKENTANKNYHYFYSNDFFNVNQSNSKYLNFPAMIAAMAEQPETQSKSPRIGLVIGQSSLPDAAPEFARHCDIVLLVDNDPLLLSSMKKRMDLILDCQSIFSERNFYEQLNSYIFYDLIKLLPDEIANDINYSTESLYRERKRTREALGEYWAFYSQKRLAEVREAVTKTHFIPVYDDIFSREFLKKMGDIFTSHNAEVHALNLTNVFDYHPKLSHPPRDTENTIEKPSELADSLKISPQALIHSSRILRRDKGSRFDPPAEHFQLLGDLLLQDIENPKHVCIIS